MNTLAKIKNLIAGARRLSRSEYIVFKLMLLLFVYIAAIVVGVLFAYFSYDIRMVAAIVCIIMFKFIDIRYSIARLHDMNLSGWWLIPCYILSIFGQVFLIFWPGDKEPNKYGER